MGKRKRTKLKHGTNASAKPIADVSLPVAPWDTGASGRANMARDRAVESAFEPEVDPDTGETRDRNPNAVKRIVYHDMLDVYHRRGDISDRGYEAGKKLRNAWEHTQRGGGVDWSQDKVDRTPRPDAQVAIRADRMTAYIRIKRQIGAADNAILMTVVCDGHSVASLRQYRALRIDDGIAHLRAALDRLADRL